MLASPNKSVIESDDQREGVPDIPPPFEEDNDLFDTDDDDNCSWWSDDEMLDSDYDGQQYIPIHREKSTASDEQKEGIVSVQYLPPNPTDNNNNNKSLTSNKSKPNVKSWVCECCNAINNLYYSIEREFECISCSNRYRPGQLLIESKEEDEPLYNPKLYAIWICKNCTWSNHIDWSKCSMCSDYKPIQNLKIFHVTDEPKAFKVNDEPKMHKRYDNDVPNGYAPYNNNCNNPLDINNPILQTQQIWNIQRYRHKDHKNKEDRFHAENRNDNNIDIENEYNKSKNKEESRQKNKKLDYNENEKVLNLFYRQQNAEQNELREVDSIKKSQEISDENTRELRVFEELQQYKEDGGDNNNDNHNDDKSVKEVLDAKLNWNGDFKFIE